MKHHDLTRLPIPAQLRSVEKINPKYLRLPYLIFNNGKKMLVIAGCTLNSCVRVSAIETQQYFKNQGLQIVVDLSLAGARTSSFRPSSLYGGLSAVESAVQEMVEAGVRVAHCVQWV